MATQRMHTEARREQIARAALDLLITRGIEEFSITDLAERVGLVPSAIYRHFRGKEEVLDAALDVFRDKLYGLVEVARDEVDNPLKALELLLSHHTRLITKGRFMPHFMLSSDMASDHTSRRAKILRIFSGYLGKIEAIVREGQKEGVIRQDADPQTIALLFIGMIQPAALLRHAEGGNLDISAHVAKVWKLFRKAVASE